MIKAMLLFPFLYLFAPTPYSEESVIMDDSYSQEESIEVSSESEREEDIYQLPEGDVFEFFHGRECPHCQNQKKWLEEFKLQYPNVHFAEYEVWHNPENQKYMISRFEELGYPAPSGVPANLINGVPVNGFDPEEIEKVAKEQFQQPETVLIPKEVQKLNPANPTVIFHTSEGDIFLEIYKNEVPSIAENFLTLAEEGKYDGTIFHRVIPGFMIQGGDYEFSNGTGGQAANGGMIEDEFNDKFNHMQGVLSMANRGPNTNGSQFFIMDGDAPWLDGKHSIFGNVIEGLDTVSSIIEAPRGQTDKPTKDIIIESVEIISD